MIFSKMRFICVRIEIGLYEVVSFLLLFPPLQIGVTLAIFRLSGYTPSLIHLLKILVNAAILNLSIQSKLGLCRPNPANQSYKSQ